MNRDRLTNMSVREAATGTMQILDAVQDERPEKVVASAAAFFVHACDRFGIRAADALTITTNIINHAEGKRPEFAAVEQFMREEWAE